MRLRRYQDETVEGLIKGFKAGNNKSLVSLYCGCLSGETVVNFNRAKKGFKVKLSHAYKSFNGKNKENHNWDRTIKTYVRSFDGKSIQLHEVDDIVYSGRKKCFRVTLSNGKTIVGTANHKILTKNGWVKIINLANEMVACDTPRPTRKKKKKKKKKNLIFNNVRYHPYAKVWENKQGSRVYYYKIIQHHRAIYEAHLNNLSIDEYLDTVRNNKEKSNKLKFVDPQKYHIHHIDSNAENNNISNLVKLGRIEHLSLHAKKTHKYNFNQGEVRFSKCVSVEKVGVIDTYDIVCRDPHHNFVANGIVAHNSGKTIIFSSLVSECEKIMDTVRVIIVVPKNILVMQTYEKLSIFVSPERISFYNAGIGVKDIRSQYVIASIQSLANCKEIPPCNLLIYDEGHILTKAHKKVYERLLAVNPKLRCVGFTATINEAEKFWPKPLVYKDLKWATSNGFACPIVLQDSCEKAKVNLQGVKLSKGDYIQNQLAPRIEEKIKDQVADAMVKCKGRKKVAWICLSIEHAEIVSQLIPERSTIIHSKMKKKARLHNIDVFEHTNCRHLVSVMQVSVGYDYPAMDCLVLLRPTRSKQLFIQAVGRVARPCDGKNNALFLDYGRVVENLGGPYSIRFDGTVVKKQGKELACPLCEFFTESTENTCHNCGHHFIVMCEHCGKIRKKGTKCDCHRSNVTWENSVKNLTNKSYANTRVVEVKWIMVKNHIANSGKKCLKVLYNDQLSPLYFRKDLKWMMAKFYHLLKGLGTTPGELNIDKKHVLPSPKFVVFEKKKDIWSVVSVETS
jgi:DNA repair protein RadD